MFVLALFGCSTYDVEAKDAVTQDNTSGKAIL